MYTNTNVCIFKIKELYTHTHTHAKWANIFKPQLSKDSNSVLFYDITFIRKIIHGYTKHRQNADFA